MPGFLQRLTGWLDRPRAIDEVAPGALAPVPHSPPPLASDDPRLPDTSRPRVARLIALSDDVEARTRAHPTLVSALTEVRQMRVHLEYLVAGYAEIPPAHRAEIFRKTGRSASYALNAGVDRMIERAEALSQSLAQEGIDSFANNLRFIEQRYGRDDPLA